ncbi:hypothetical protein N7451_003112 [Penicillium sp. IBT 35674x]|nr:hypothetical protein N7451_003112 [Penicillium sp. IBT 35674x]
MRVVIVGAGLGRLACAISCRRDGIEEVLVLERAATIGPVGAGVQVPPNAKRIMKYLGLLEKLGKKSDINAAIDLRGYETGEVLYTKPGSDHSIKTYRVPWYYPTLKLTDNGHQACVIERTIITFFQNIDFEKNEVQLQDESIFSGDVIIGANGLWSVTRDRILGYPSPPTETGDMAYRAIFNTETLQALNQPKINSIIDAQVATAWFGPGGHVIMYPLSKDQKYNMVLIRPDDMPEGVKIDAGIVEELKEAYKGWDPALFAIISRIESALKWKLLHHKELESWVKADYPIDVSQDKIHFILKLYEKVRKSRTSLNVLGAVANRQLYHIVDGSEQEQRDRDLRDLIKHSKWQFTDDIYQNDLLGFDVIKDAEKQYAIWKTEAK